MRLYVKRKEKKRKRNKAKKKEKRKTELIGEEKRGWKNGEKERILKVKQKGSEQDERGSSEVCEE